MKADDKNFDEIFNNSIFIVRLIKSNNENFPADTYFVGTSLEKTLYACMVLIKASDGIAIVDVWKNNSPRPIGTITPISTTLCKECDYKKQCDEQNNNSLYRFCNRFKYENQRKSNVLNEKKPEGLTNDIDAADIIIEAVKILNELT